MPASSQCWKEPWGWGPVGGPGTWLSRKSWQVCRVEEDPFQQAPRPFTLQGASGSAGQTSHTCLEASEEPSWGPGGRSVLGVLPGLEEGLPARGQDRQMCPRPCQRPGWPQLINPASPRPSPQPANQSHNSIPSSKCSGSQIRPWKSDSTWTF